MFENSSHPRTAKMAALAVIAAAAMFVPTAASASVSRTASFQSSRGAPPASPEVTNAKSAATLLMASYDPEKAWWPSSWWNSAVALQNVEECMLRTRNRSYLSQVDNTFEKDKGAFPAGELSGDPLLGDFTSRALDDS